MMFIFYFEYIDCRIKNNLYMITNNYSNNSKLTCSAFMYI